MNYSNSQKAGVILNFNAVLFGGYFIYEEQSAYLDEFINRLAVERNLAGRTLYAYHNDISGLLRWSESSSVETLNDRSIFAYFIYLQNEKCLMAKSLRRKYVSVQQYCRFLNLEGKTKEIFFRFSTRRFQIPRRLPKTLTSDEIVKLIRTAERDVREAPTDYRNRLAVRNDCMIDMMYSLGLRIGEVAALNVEDYSGGDHSVLIRGKGERERVLYISSEEVREKLNRWLVIRDEMEPEDHALFLNKSGKRLSIYGIENIFYKYRDDAEINPDVTPHFLRHTFATQLLNNGAGIRDVQELLGHKSIVTTQIYTEVSLYRKKYVLENYNGRNFLEI